MLLETPSSSNPPFPPLPSPPPTPSTQNMDAELFLGKEQEEVEESTTPYQVSRLLQEAFYKADKVRALTGGMQTTCSAQPSPKDALGLL